MLFFYIFRKKHKNVLTSVLKRPSTSLEVDNKNDQSDQHAA